MAKSQSSCGVEYFYLIVSEVKTLITLHGVFQEIPPTVNLPTLVGGALTHQAKEIEEPETLVIQGFVDSKVKRLIGFPEASQKAIIALNALFPCSSITLIPIAKVLA